MNRRSTIIVICMFTNWMKSHPNQKCWFPSMTNSQFPSSSIILTRNKWKVNRQKFITHFALVIRCTRSNWPTEYKRSAANCKGYIQYLVARGHSHSQHNGEDREKEWTHSHELYSFIHFVNSCKKKNEMQR